MTNGIDPSDFDDEETTGALPEILQPIADLFVQSSASTEGAKRVANARAALNRAIRNGWEYEELPMLVRGAVHETTWGDALRRWVLMPIETAERVAPKWVCTIAEALAKRHLYEAGPKNGKGGQQVQPQEVRFKVGKVRTAFLEMVLSWAAAGGKDAEERASSVAAVIALARDRPDVEARVQVFINETW